MRPAVWEPPIELSTLEQQVVKRIRRAKLFVFLRLHRHRLFSIDFQAELATLYEDSSRGQPPIPPAQLALATLLQAYSGVSDDEVIEASLMDRRWQLVLDCLDSDTAPFSKGTLVAFRAALIKHNLDRRLIERTVELAEQSGDFGSRQLRVALDSSPLWGAARVEDTFNLLGHALRKALGVLAAQQGRELAEVASAAGAELVSGSSLKAALDLDWDDPAQQQQALQLVLAALAAGEAYLREQDAVEQPQVKASLAAAAQVQEQDVTTDAAGGAILRQGVAPERRISIEDAQMRHGRKSKSRLIDGYKRHVLRDLDSELLVAVGITPANAPEASVTESMAADLLHLGISWRELHIDRAYLSSSWVRQRQGGQQVYCKTWPVRNGVYFDKTAFTLDWEKQTIRCPNGIELNFELGALVHFPVEQCDACGLRERCTSSKAGRSVSIHPDEALLAELRERQQTASGRAKLRERVGVEHSLAHVGHWQGEDARYIGVRKNLFDLRRCAVVNNLHVLARSPQFLAAAA